MNTDDYKPCICGHMGFDHSDVDLDELGDCYLCDCKYFAEDDTDDGLLP